MLGMANALKQTANQHKTTLLVLFLLVLVDYCFFIVNVTGLALVVFYSSISCE